MSKRDHQPETAADAVTTRGTPPRQTARPKPLLLPTSAFLVGILLSELVGGGSETIRRIASLMPFVLFGVLLSFAIRRPPRTVLLSGMIVAVAIGCGFSRHQIAVHLPPDHIAHLTTEKPILTRIAGRIVTQPTTTPAEKRNLFLPFDPSPQTRFVLDAAELRTTDPPIPISGYVRVSVKAESVAARMGETVVVTGRLYRPHGPRNPGETDWARWYRLQNIHAGLTVDGDAHVRRVEAEHLSGHRLIALLRGYAQSLLFEPFAPIESDQPLRLLDAMVLGHRSAAGRQLNEAFLRTGTIHFLTVSGFHVGVLAGAVWLLVRRVLRRRARTAAVATMIVIVLYALIVEHNAPILRAATMGILLCLAQLTRRPFCGLNWLAFSALCVLTYNPLELFRAGFQLSFVQVLALLTIVPHLYRLVVRRRTDDEIPADADTYRGLLAHRLWRWLVGLIVVCVSAWIVSLPLVLFHFGRFAPWGALQSIVVSPLVMLTIVLGFLALIGLAIVPPIGALLGFLLRGATHVLLWAVERLSQLPGTLVETQRPPSALVVFAYAGLLLLLWSWWPRSDGRENQPAGKKRKARRVAGTLCALALACGSAVAFLVPQPGRPGGVAVHVLSVGSGAAALVTTPHGSTALFDVGTIHNFDAGQTVVQAARALGIHKLDLLAVSHANFDHYSGVPTVVANLPTRRLVTNPYFVPAASDKPSVRRVLDLLPTTAPPPTVWQAGERLELADVALEVLWPPADLGESWEPNDRSLVIRLNAYGRTVIIPGDIERAALRGLLDLHASGQINLSADILIAPHHGAVVPGDTAAFYEAVAPQVVINSTGRERPKLAKMLEGLAGAPVRLVSTHDAGAVSVCITPDGAVGIQTPFAPQAD